MLRELTIENIAVIKKTTVSFDSGLCVLTGETGAGKSIIIDSVGALMGNRIDKDLVRSGTDKATICALFDCLTDKVSNLLYQFGIENEGEILICREITSEGKGSVRINGKPALVSMLRQIVPLMLNIHGQQENHSLLSSEAHTNILDTYGRLTDIVNAYNDTYSLLCDKLRQQKTLLQGEFEKKQRVDLLRYQIDEINSADFKEDEPEYLRERNSVLQNAEKLESGLSGAGEALQGDEYGAVDAVSAAMAKFSEINGLSGETQDLYRRISDVYYELSDICGEISKHIDDIAGEPGESAIISDRLDLLYRFEKKYGNGVQEINSFSENAQQELQLLENSELFAQQLDGEIEDLTVRANSMATDITKRRKDAFARLQKEIEISLQFLNMPDIQFMLRCEPTPLMSGGRDCLEFLISTNPGEVPKPLCKIASGGELSRIMLALKKSLAEADDIPTVIYDEIDTGVSGAAAFKIGQMMRETSTGRQVIAVTHSAQIAAFANRHLFIEKNIDGERASTKIYELSQKQREGELARIISGNTQSQTAIANAREMIDAAQKKRGDK